MKKWMMFFFCALLALLPLSATAEGLPEVLGAVSKGLAQGLVEGAQFSGQDLSLTFKAEDTRIEEGRTLLVTITAENPYPAATDVTLTLKLPKRLSCAQPTVWQAQLDPAAADPKTGSLVPSVTVFTREVTLTPDSGESESAQMLVEMSMGARFYRADAPIELCVPVVSASAEIEGTQDGFLLPGEPFALLLHLNNDGDAPKDVPITLTLPEGVSAGAQMPQGIVLRGRMLCGTLRAEAGSSQLLRLPLVTDKALLDGDEDASRMLCSVLTVDGERVSAPVLRVVGPLISAKLTPEFGAFKEGGVMNLTVTVVNAGLAPADVEVACLLPEGLALVRDADAQKDKKKENETPLSSASSGKDGNVPPTDGAAQPVMNEILDEPEVLQKDGLLHLRVHMDAARETGSGAAAAIREIPLRVRADQPEESVEGRLLGAALAWKTNGGETQLGEAIAMQIRGDGLFGLSHSEWNGILLAALLMLITICCLYSAVRSENRQDDYCFE